MKIEIWSDVVCPFCYIGKRKLEKSIAKMPFKDSIEIEWKSFMLNPNARTQPEINSQEHLAKSKGWTLEQTKQISNQVTTMAAEEGLEYHLDKTIVANSINSHRLLHLAKSKSLGSEMKERLLKAYFTEGLNIDDEETLVKLGEEVGLKDSEVREVLDNSLFQDGIENDFRESREIGVQGVPFFVIDRKYGVSGAQPDAVFDDSLKKAWDKRY